MQTHPLNPVPPTPSLPVEIAIQALLGQGDYGVVTDLSRDHKISRYEVYQLREHARTALDDAFEQEAFECLTLPVTEADIARTVIALRIVAPSSIRDIVAMLPVIYGTGHSWSYGKVQGVLCEAQQRAGAFSGGVDLSGIESVALDEMFSQGRPVFGGIDLDTQYLFQLQEHPSRTGEDWERSLSQLRDKQCLNPRRIVKDAGTGLAKGVTNCWTSAEQNDDLFHAVLLMGREAYHLERRAYKSLGQEYELEEKRSRANPKKRRKLGQQVRRARERCEQAIDRFDRFESLHREALQVLELSTPGSGQLHTCAQVVETLTRVADEMESLGGGRIGKVARYIRNRAPGLGRYLEDLGQRLLEVTDQAGGPEVMEATVRAYQAGLMVGRKAPYWEQRARKQELSDAAEHLLNVTSRAPNQVCRALETVVPVLARRYRASSAIENLNSVLRPYLVVHKHVGQGFLNLFQYYWNTRKREWGRGKGTSAYEQLTGKKVEDWLTLLGYPPGAAFAAAA